MVKLICFVVNGVQHSNCKVSSAQRSTLYNYLSYIAANRCNGCHRLVSGNYGVPDNALSASSVHSAPFSASVGRLYGPRSWHPVSALAGKWILVGNL